MPGWEEQDDGLDDLDPSALAWEFLRRNPAYREAYAAGRDIAEFGLLFPLDPDLPASAVDPMWREDVAPAIAVRFVPAVASQATSRRLGEAAAFRRENEEGVHLRFPGGLQAHLPPVARPEQPLGAVLPFSRDLAIRILAARAVHRAMFGQCSRLPKVSRARARRLVRALRAHDLRQSNATYREIAERLLRLPAMGSAQWRTSSERASVIRLCSAGSALANGGHASMLGSR